MHIAEISVTEMDQSSSPEKPLGVAMVICERVIIEQDTQNKTIVSTFNTIDSEDYPCRHDRLAVYVALTNASGEKRVKLRFRRSEDETPLFDMGGPARFEHPNHVCELIFNMRNLVLPEPGVYLFEVYADDEYVFEVKFNAVKRRERI